MDPRKLSFLQAVIGPDGAKALAKAAVTPDLEWALLPRVVMSWLEVVAHGSYHGALPGIDETHLVLRKGETDFDGSITIGTDTYTFRDASIYHVAGSVAVAMGLDHEPQPALRHPALAKLGKSIDVLVKARTLRKASAQHSGGAKGVTLPGTAAKPQAPLAPLGPVAIQPKIAGPGVGTKSAVSAKPTASKTSPGAPPAGAAGKPKVAPPKLPGIKQPTIKVSKAESKTPCPACGAIQFKDDRYVGCICFADLCKHTRTMALNDGYVIELGKGWHHEEICVLAEGLGK